VKTWEIFSTRDFSNNGLLLVLCNLHIGMFSPIYMIKNNIIKTIISKLFLATLHV